MVRLFWVLPLNILKTGAFSTGLTKQKFWFYRISPNLPQLQRCGGMKRKTFLGNNWFLGLNVSITVLGNVETDLFLVLWSGPSQRNPLGVMTHNYDTQHPDHSTHSRNSNFDTTKSTLTLQTLLLTIKL